MDSIAQRLRRNSSGGDGSSIQASFSENSSRLLNSVNAGRKNLFGGLSTKIDQVQTALKKAGTIDLGDTGVGAPSKEKETTDAAPGRGPRRSASVKKSDKPKPKKPPPPKLTRRTTVNGALGGGYGGGYGGTVDGTDNTSGTIIDGSKNPFVAGAGAAVGSTGPSGGDVGAANTSGRVKVPANIAINFDEPLYTEQLEPSVTSQLGLRPTDIAPYASDRNKSVPHKNPFLDDNFADQDSNPPMAAQSVFPAGMKPASLGADLLPGIPRVPSTGSVTFLAPQQPPADLLAITPTSGQALPMPSLEPTRRRSDAEEIFDDSDGGDSEATEGCDESPDAEDGYGREEDYGGPMFRSGSVCSERSWSSALSNENDVDELTLRCMNFMKEFVAKVFDSE
ncbi:hypothetical protein NP493_96g00001 [Ridgeia piscesae]|uniref:Uncharacterized protein n=1 Tax=Ridgeia piscesae TaxID=27915 RepID=A0AAD9UHV7_RIDPI|nr:hypothetical protein NP493_96g00001 [Ridgeia piscesae]